MKQFHADRFRLAPFTVVVDPARAGSLLATDADPHLAYLFRCQLAEANLVCFSKADVGCIPPALPGIRVRSLSARTGAGVPEWLAEVLEGEVVPRHVLLLDVDYAKYAEAEAALAWMNCKLQVRLGRPLSPAVLVGLLLEQLDGELTSAAAEIAHMKVFAKARSGFIKASVTRNGEDPAVEGQVLAGSSNTHELSLNIRAKCTPETMNVAADRALAMISGKITMVHRECFQPGRPMPEHRFNQTV